MNWSFLFLLIFLKAASCFKASERVPAKNDVANFTGRLERVYFAPLVLVLWCLTLVATSVLIPVYRLPSLHSTT